MFEHLRAEREAARAAVAQQIAAVVAQRDLAVNRVQEVAARVPPFEDALAQAVAGTNGPNAALADAEAVVAQRAAQREGRQAQRTAAGDAVARHEQEEPPDELDDRGKPTIERRLWAREHLRLQRAVVTAQQALDEAQAAWGAAQSVRDARAQEAAVAGGVVMVAQRRLGAARQDVAWAEQVVEGLDRAVAVLEQQVGDVDAGIGALDARAARLTADPLNRADLQLAADAELAAVLDYRRQRRALLDRRAAARAQRAAQLAAADATADGLAGLRAEILAWPDAGRYPELGGVAAILGDIVDSSRARRGTPPDGRDDDIEAVTARLSGLAQVLAGIVGRVTAERDAAQQQVDAVAAQLRAHQEAAP